MFSFQSNFSREKIEKKEKHQNKLKICKHFYAIRQCISHISYLFATKFRATQWLQWSQTKKFDNKNRYQ